MVKEVSKKLSSSIPYRLGLLFTLIYLICYTIGALLFYASMQRGILDQVDQDLVGRYENLQNVFKQSGMEGVAEVCRLDGLNNPMQHGVGFELSGPNGEVFDGNISGFGRENGFYNVNGKTLGFGEEQNYRFYTNDLGDNHLTLAVNQNLLDDLRKNSISSFFLTFILTTILALLSCIFLANRSHARVRKLASFMENVGKGNLNARLPISYRGDDIDNLSANMNDALTLLQKQINGMKQVSNDIAHDLKTPLNRLNIKIEEAKSLADPESSVINKLEDAGNEATQINETFEALLRISQIEAGARRSGFKETDLTPILQNAYEVYEVVAEENQQVIDLDISYEKLTFLGDANLLLQLVVNLIENAIRHCPPDTIITIRSGIADNCPWISVCDNGYGIPEDARERVFERLYRLEDSRTTKGSGLGLSLVKAIVDVHGGSISLSDNQPGLCVKVAFSCATQTDW